MFYIQERRYIPFRRPFTRIHARSHAYVHIDTTPIPCSMDHDQIPLITQNMSFTDVYPVNDQPQEDPTWHQSPPPLLAFSSTFSPHNPFLNYLPSIPSSSNNDQHHHFPLNNEQNRPFPTVPLPFSSNNEQHRHFPLNNEQNHPFPTVPLPFSSHNNPNCPFIPTNTSSHNTEHCPFVVPQFPSFPDLHTEPPIYITHNPHYVSLRYPPYQNPQSALPDFKDSTLPSSTFIPLLTGRADWGAWSDTVSMAIMNMNLYSHIAEQYTPWYGFDPGLKPTYPPIIDENASQSDIISLYDWWRCDGQVSRILFSRLSASARSQLSGAGATHHTRRTAGELYDGNARGQRNIALPWFWNMAVAERTFRKSRVCPSTLSTCPHRPHGKCRGCITWFLTRVAAFKCDVLSCMYTFTVAYWPQYHGSA